MSVHVDKFVRDDGETEIEVEFTIRAGEPASWDHPGCGPEVEIDRAWLLGDETDGEIKLTEEEEERIMQAIAESDDYLDDGPDPDDARDQMIDDRLCGYDG